MTHRTIVCRPKAETPNFLLIISVAKSTKVALIALFLIFHSIITPIRNTGAAGVLHARGLAFLIRLHLY
jgi:uncharacterized membrane protein